MSEIIPGSSGTASEGPATNIGKFLAKRGSLIVTETRVIGNLKCELQKHIEITTMVIYSVATANLLRADKLYGVRLVQASDEGETAAIAHLDFEELDEFAKAAGFLEAIAKRVPPKGKDYTEVVYNTKDGVRFGFFTGQQRPDGFIQVGGALGESVFIPVGQFTVFQQLILEASAHLVERGAIA